MSSISTHVLDTARGAPAAGVAASLEVLTGGEWIHLAKATTNADGRIAQFAAADAALPPGIYRLRFDTGAYQAGFYPEVTITFRMDSADQHYHVPLLLSPFGYSTYRGS